MRVGTAAIATLAAAASVTFAVPAAAATTAQIRVDQVGYATGETKAAYLMGTTSNAGASFSVVDSTGKSVLTGKVGASTGNWSTAYSAVYPIDISGLQTAGTYQIKVGGTVSPKFQVDSAAALYSPIADDVVKFFQVQRDGDNVIPGVLNRKPSHLADKTASVYAVPTFTGDDTITSKMTKTGVTVDASGGWFDAGDFLKFTETTSYAVTNLLLSERARGSASLTTEARYGLDFLGKMWDAKNGVLYAQVGVGGGSSKENFDGDHDVWRLPEADDALNVKPGDADYYVKFRPVFAANKAGAKISPNLAGRVAAAFAVAAQNLAATDKTKAQQYLSTAAAIYALADTSGGSIVSAYPHGYYPESSYLDDLELGATELSLAGTALGDSRATGWATDAGKYASSYLASSDKGTLNVYDTSAEAHADLVKVLRSPNAPKLAVTEAQLTGDLARQLSDGVAEAAKSPFRTGASVTDFDVASHSFGFVATALLYGQLTGKHDYDAFATQQRDFTLGSNAWGTSLVVGVGSTFPDCMQHQVANLAGSLTGGTKVAVGAVVNGPNNASLFKSIDSLPDGGKKCGITSYKTYDSTTSRYMDDARTWQSSEPAIDFTSTAALAFSLTAAG
ncbi:glycoside hydrolase family 9 protein [Kutzneria buriramensis]|uniref:Cellulase-like Ig domain-containing protein n=1 Tax=Kutzneria buriramensis TaxID=1045776 RepID=A0A3E0HAU1_9PSEU|nr:glycoside hydrolase family 9 protein [Kutzneria buriramensis]REH41154.1 cellulase-like Ig domain-containing protein [Kutzneria buriramensis]